MYSRMSALSSAMRMRDSMTSRPTAPVVAGAAAAVGVGSHRNASCTYGGAPIAVETVDRAAPTRSCGRCATPVGSEMMNVVPCSKRLSTRTVPLCIATSSRTSDRPIPEPS